MIPLKDDNPTRSFPIFTLIIIAVNIAIFIYQLSLGPDTTGFIMRLAAVPYEIVNLTDVPPYTNLPIPATLFTSMFIHGNLMHLGGNMLYLWIFGNNIEDALGHFRFIIFYTLCGLLGTAAHIISIPASTVPLVGASGAISGVLGAYLLIYPAARVHTLIFIIFFIRIVRLPAFILLTLWFLMQVLNSSGGGNVAWYAHIGGFVGGLLIVKPFMKGKGKQRT